MFPAIVLETNKQKDSRPANKTQMFPNVLLKAQRFS